MEVGEKIEHYTSLITREVWCLPLVAVHFGNGLLKNLKSLKWKENIDDI